MEEMILNIDDRYSTTRRVIKADPVENPEALAVIANAVKQSHKPEDKFETLLYLPEGEVRQGEGGLRTQGYFKVGGLIQEESIAMSLRGALATRQSIDGEGVTTNEAIYHEDSHSHSSESGNLASPLTEEAPSPETKPLITVVTVVFNGEQYLEETILSVINQTYDNVEYIIIDGGSTDGTLDIIKKYEHAIDYWVSEKDKGIYDAMNKGIRLANGEIIGLINADDYYLETTVESVVETFKVSKPDVLFGNKTALNEDLKIQKSVSVSLPTSMQDLAVHAVHPTVFVKRKVYQENLFDLKYRIAADYEFLLSIYDKGAKFYKLDQILAVMRTDGVSGGLNIDSAKIRYQKIGVYLAIKSIITYFSRRIIRYILYKIFNSSTLRKIYLKFGWESINPLS